MRGEVPVWAKLTTAAPPGVAPGVRLEIEVPRMRKSKNQDEIRMTNLYKEGKGREGKQLSALHMNERGSCVRRSKVLKTCH